MTDVLIRGKDRHTNKRRLLALKSGQTTSFWRGKKPRRVEEGLSRVYFVDQGRVYAWATYLEYRYKSGPNLQGEPQSGGALAVRGPTRAVRPSVPVPTGELRGRWRWRYVTPTMARRLRRSK